MQHEKKQRRRKRLFWGAILLGVASVIFLVYEQGPEVARRDRISEATSAGPEATAATDLATPRADNTDSLAAGGQSPGVPITSWEQEFYETDDLYAYAIRAAEAAMAGDARAQYFLSRALRDCSAQTGPIERSGIGIEDYLAQHWSQFPFARDGDKRKLRQQIEQCKRFLEADSLSRSSLPPDPQTHEYWFEQANANGDPLASMDRSELAIGHLLSEIDAETELQVKAQMRSGVRLAVESKEPTAIARVASLYFNAHVALDQSFQGPAWWVAACELGFDCSTENPAFTLRDYCQQYQPTCLTLQDILIRDLGSARYAQIYAAGQDIAYRVQVGDWDGLQQYLEMK